MTALMNVLNALSRALLVVAGLALVAMMCVTIVDVLLRNFGNYFDALRDVRFYGSIEMVRYLFLVAMAGTMPWGVEKSQVIVELFTQNWPESVRNRIDAFFLLGFTVLGAAMAWSLLQAGMHAVTNNETTPDLGMPVSWSRYVAAFCMALMAVRALFLGIHGIRKGELNVG